MIKRKKEICAILQIFDFRKCADILEYARHREGGREKK